MGAGKTILIGAIFATEFAMAFDYPQGPFVKNAGLWPLDSVVLSKCEDQRCLQMKKFPLFKLFLRMSLDPD